MSFGWEGEKVRLVPLDKARHFENCVRWLNNPEVTQWMLTGDFPITRVAEEEFFERVSRQNDTEVIFAIETLEEEHIGVCGLMNICFRHGTGNAGLTIGRQRLWGRGYGTDAIAQLTRYSFHTLGLRLLLADVMPNNVASLRVFIKNGYREVGRLPQRWWKRGGYQDDIQFALLREEWTAK